MPFCFIESSHVTAVEMWETEMFNHKALSVDTNKSIKVITREVFVDIITT